MRAKINVLYLTSYLFCLPPVSCYFWWDDLMRINPALMEEKHWDELLWTCFYWSCCSVLTYKPVVWPIQFTLPSYFNAWKYSRDKWSRCRNFFYIGFPILYFFCTRLCSGSKLPLNQSEPCSSDSCFLPFIIEWGKLRTTLFLFLYMCNYWKWATIN